jgi:CheY-like chemotaxis protein
VWVAEQRRRVFAGAVAAIWDGTSHGQVDFDHLRLVVSQLPDVPVLALLGFPRYDQQQQARACGACGVLATPFLLPDLWESLHQMTSRDGA